MTSQSSWVKAPIWAPVMTTASTRSSVRRMSFSAQPSSIATSRRVGQEMMFTLRAIASAVRGWSPVTIVTWRESEREREEGFEPSQSHEKGSRCKGQPSAAGAP